MKRPVSTRISGGLPAALMMLMAIGACQTPEAPKAPVEEKKTFAQIAVKTSRPPGFPAPSAVCFSSRWKHPRDAKDPHDSFKAAAGFHATGFYWTYGPDAEWFREIKRHGYTVQGWLSTILPDTLFGNTRQKGRILNEKGERVTGPWMLSWKGWWGCFNSPEYRAIYLAYVKMYLDAGVDLLQMDDPGENDTAVRWGGCYCPYCKTKAARLGKTPPEIQRESTEEFYRYIRAEMNACAKRHVPFSCNSHPGDRYFYADTFDFGIEELDHTTPGSFYNAMRDAARRGKAQMYTFRSESVPETRRTIALAYACGSHIIVPWDVYMPGQGAPRYFGKPEEYADLYGFARANASCLDGYEDAAFLMSEAPDDRYPQTPLAVAGGSESLNLFVRAVPGKSDAPVVIHCLDMSETPKPFRMHIDPARFFGDQPVTIDLLTPAPYDPAAHAHAEQTKNFASLAVRQRLAAGCVTSFEVPAVGPWGLIVITPDPSAPRRVWSPSILADGQSLYSRTLSVDLACATRDAVIRYTLDGTEPGTSSTPYTRPIVLTDSTTVKARSYVGSTASGGTTVSFRKIAEARVSGLPDTLPGLCLWLRARDLLTSHTSGDFIARWPAKTGPAMVSEPVKLYNGRTATAPVLEACAINRKPAVRFKSGSDLLVIPGFADEHLRGAFTIFMVTRSGDKLFGACGNSRNGNGGTPRLYLMRDAFTYNASSLHVGVTSDTPALLAYSHDGINTLEVWFNGHRSARGSGDAYTPVKSFGGGHLAIPFWCGNDYHGGDVAEVIVFDRRLEDRQREGVEQYLAEEYGLRTVKQWD